MVPAGTRRRSARMLASPFAVTVRTGLAIVGSAVLAGCAIQTQSSLLAAAARSGRSPDDSDGGLCRPAHPGSGSEPGCRQHRFESENGVDRYWSADSVLTAWLTADFGGAMSGIRYAPLRDGQVLAYLKKPVRIDRLPCRVGAGSSIMRSRSSCPSGTSGWWRSPPAGARSSPGGRSGAPTGPCCSRTRSTAACGRSRVSGRPGGWNGRVQGFLGADDRGAWLDLSRVLKARRRAQLRARHARRA